MTSIDGRKNEVINRNHNKDSGRLIPKRGEVKMGIVVRLAHSVAAIFTPVSR